MKILSQTVWPRNFKLAVVVGPDHKMTPIVLRSKVKVTVTLVEKWFSINNCKTVGPRSFKLAMIVNYDYMMTPIVF